MVILSKRALAERFHRQRIDGKTWPKIAEKADMLGVYYETQQSRWTGESCRKIYMRYHYEPVARPKRRNHGPPLIREKCPDYRPCPYVSCRHHIGLEPELYRSTIHYARPGVKDGDLSELDESCSLDFHMDPKSLEEIAQILGSSRANMQRTAMSALNKIEAQDPTLGKVLKWLYDKSK